MKDLISIIVPVYNAEKYLKRSINSLMNQTYKNIEILLIDDESKDDSLKICREFAKLDSRIKVFSKKNSGPSLTRKIGFKNSTGKYIMFLDADDYFESDACEYLLKLIKKKKVSIACCNYCINDLMQDNEEIIKVFKNDKILEEYYNNADIKSCIWNKLYTKNIIQDDFFENDIKNAEDVLFTCQVLLRCNSLCVSNLCKIHYNQENVSLSRSVLSKKKISDIFIAHQTQINLIHDSINDDNIRAKSVEKMYNALIGLYNQAIIEKDIDNINYVYNLIEETNNRYASYNNISPLIMKKISLILRHNFIYRKAYYVKNNKFYSFVQFVIVLIAFILIWFPILFKKHDEEMRNELIKMGNNYISDYNSGDTDNDIFDSVKYESIKDEFAAYKDGYCLLKLSGSYITINTCSLNKCILENSPLIRTKQGNNITIDDVENPLLYNYILYGALSEDIENMSILISDKDLDLIPQIVDTLSNNNIELDGIESLRGFDKTFDYINYRNNELIQKIEKVIINDRSKVDIEEKNNTFFLNISNEDQTIKLEIGEKEKKYFESKYRDYKNEMFLYYKLLKPVVHNINSPKIDIKYNSNFITNGISSVYLFYYGNSN